MDLYEFIRITKPNHLTLGDVLKWRVGHVEDVVLWCEDFEDLWISDYAIKDKYYHPEDFFAANRCKLVYQGNMKWDIIFCTGLIIEHHVHLNTSALNTSVKWCAVNSDGYIHIDQDITPTCGHLSPNRKIIDMHWREFPTHTRIGWRGPIMSWKYLKDYSHVFLDSHDDDIEIIDY